MCIVTSRVPPVGTARGEAGTQNTQNCAHRGVALRGTITEPLLDTAAVQANSGTPLTCAVGVSVPSVGSLCAGPPGGAAVVYVTHARMTSAARDCGFSRDALRPLAREEEASEARRQR